MMEEVTNEVNEGVPLEETAPEIKIEVIAKSEKDEEVSPSRMFSVKKVLGLLLAPAILLILGLSLGLTQNNNTTSTTSTTDTTPNDNVAIFDEAVAILESTPRQFKDLSSGETMAYREFNEGQPHVLVFLPGYMTDDSMASILPALDEFQDHHIIAVNPIGWNGSSMNSPVYSHEENAERVMELIEAIGIKTKVMAMGYSTGGGIAFFLAQKYPEVFSAAFLMHSIPLNGMRYMTSNGDPVYLDSFDEAEKLSTSMPQEMDFGDPDWIYEYFKSFSSNKEGYIPKDHKLVEYMTDAAINMPGKIEASIANISFNVTPIKTAFSDPSDALSSLQSKVIVIHGSRDVIVPAVLVESVTKLAIADRWAPTGMLSFYDDEEGHMLLVDNPRVFAEVYRLALEEQVLV